MWTAKFDIGQKVKVDCCGQGYTTYADMAKKLGVFDAWTATKNKAATEGEIAEIVGFHPHMDHSDIGMLYACKRPNGEIFLIGERGLAGIHAEYLAFSETRTKVLEWAEARNLLKGSTAKDQTIKLMEEVGELAKAVGKSDRAKVIDGIGDAMVVLTLIANYYETTPEECYSVAYEEIKDRKGRMVNGTFVKEADL